MFGKVKKLNQIGKDQKNLVCFCVIFKPPVPSIDLRWGDATLCPNFLILYFLIVPNFIILSRSATLEATHMKRFSW